MKKKGEAWGELEGWIFSEARFSSRKSSVAFFFVRRQWVDLFDLQDKGFIKVDFMVVGL